jgi:integrase/recombinase XerD
MSPLRAALDDYLRIRRSLGFKLEIDGKMLEQFIAFLERAGAIWVTTKLALDWAKLPRDAHPYHWRNRLGMVRLFARYLATIDPRTEIPSKDLLLATRRRLAPYIYSPAEIAALMTAAHALSPASRATTIETLIGLMAATGLRLGEALRLDRSDVDFDDGVLRVYGKLGKEREVSRPVDAGGDEPDARRRLDPQVPGRGRACRRGGRAAGERDGQVDGVRAVHRTDPHRAE